MQSDVQQTIASLKPWFHNLHLGNGVQTAPDHFLGDFPHFKWKQIKPFIEKDLSGKHVLDIGCNAGFYSFELARLGAMVTAIDIDDHYLHQARWAAEILKLSDAIHFERKQVYDLAHEDTVYDVTWFMGVLYHLRYPTLALDIICEHTRDLLILQTLMMPDHDELITEMNYPIDERDLMLKPGWPKFAFIENRLNGDPTNWWVPNRSGVLAVLRSCGFSLIANPEPETFILKRDSDRIAVAANWNRSEYLSAIGKPYEGWLKQKTHK